MDIQPLWQIAEPVSALTHLGGALACAWAARSLVERGGGCATRSAHLALFAVSAVLLLSASGAYHLLPREMTARAVMRRLDHAAIFLFIAASFTTGHGLFFRGAWRWGMIALAWTGCLAGAAVRLPFLETLPDAAGVAIYAGLGWLGAASVIRLSLRLGWRRTSPVIWGGIAYTAAAVIEVLEAPVVIPGVVQSHEVVHLVVLSGILLHWKFLHEAAASALAPDEEQDPACAGAMLCHEASPCGADPTRPIPRGDAER